ELGGPNHIKRSVVLDKDGPPLKSSSGYYYFGAAKNLKGVREMFEQQTAEQGERKLTKKDLLERATPEYNGYFDETAELLEAEREAEMEWLRANPVA
ncbi:Isy1-like splicing family protein, partial [Kipferlia bialata]